MARQLLTFTMRHPLSNVPLLPLLLAIVVGILVADCSLWVWMAALTVMVAIGIPLRGTGAISLSVAMLIGAFSAWSDLPPEVNPEFLDKEIIVQARINSISPTERYFHCDAAILSIPEQPVCRLTVTASNIDLEVGDIVAVTARFSQPVNDSVPDARDYVAFLSRQGISLTAIVPSENITIFQRHPNIFTYANRVRNHIRSAILSAPFASQTVEFLTATLIGDDSLLDNSVRATFSSAGLAHVLALSGLHVGIVTAIIAIILLPLRLIRRSRINSRIYPALIIVSLWGYAFITGLSPSVVRAVIMATCLIAGRMLQRHHSSLNALIFAAILILIFSPMSIFSAGFQMSFAAVASILVLAKPMNPISTKHRRLRDFVALFCVSTAAMIGTGVISISYFHSFPVIFLLANVIITPLLPLIFALAIVVIAFSAMGIDIIWIASAVDWLYSAIISFAEWLQSLPLATVRNIFFPAWLLIPYFLAVAALTLFLYSKRAVYAITALALIVFVILVTQIVKPSYPQEELIFSNEKRVTNIIYRHGNRAVLITTATAADRPHVRDNCFRRYEEYFRRRNVDSLAIANDTYRDFGITRNHHTFTALGKTYAIYDTPDSITVPSHINYAIICRRFRGNPAAIARNAKIDTIILSRDINRRLLRRYTDSLTTHHIPFRTL